MLKDHSAQALAKDPIPPALKPERLKAPAILPIIRVRGTSIVCNAMRLDLKERPMTLRLISAFTRNPKKRLSRKQLMEVVYSGFEPDDRSERFREILGHNVTKLVSRARLLMDQAFNPKHKPWIEFFVYDSDRGYWHFYRLTNEYLSQKESEFSARFFLH